MQSDSGEGSKVRGAAAALLAAIAVVAAGCGGGSNKAGTGPAATVSDTLSPARALRALLAAARSGDESRIRALLTPTTRRTVALELAEGLGSFPAQTKVILAQQIDATWAVAALAGPRRGEGMREYGVFAVALKRVGDRWKAHIGPDTVRIRPLGPDPGSVHGRAPTQVAAEFSALVGIAEAGVWLDGEALSATTSGSAVRYTAYGPSPPLRRGIHTVVAFAEAGGSATATAWIFRVR